MRRAAPRCLIAYEDRPNKYYSDDAPSSDLESVSDLLKINMYQLKSGTSQGSVFSRITVMAS